MSAKTFDFYVLAYLNVPLSLRQITLIILKFGICLNFNKSLFKTAFI
jgi:hypothetical protein